MANLGIPEQTRLVHESVFPLCTFGYAVTRAAAKKILNDIAPPRAPPPTVARAFDVVILRACRQGRGITTSDNKNNNEYQLNESNVDTDKALRCLTINPELMHHRPGASLIAGADTSVKQINRPPVDVAADEVIQRTGETANIECGFWSGDFDWEGGNEDENEEGDKDRQSEDIDKKRLMFLREEVGEKGRCLKRGREII